MSSARLPADATHSSAAELRPDVVLLDINLPDLSGLVVADPLAEGVCAPMVVLISSREAESFGRRLHDAAALGFLSKRDLTGDALARLLA